MLEDVRRSYVQMASVVVPNWRKLDVNTLCNLYLEHEENPFERSGYFSAVLLMAENSDKKFFSVSMFSSRWAESKIYLPFSSPKRA